MSVRSDRRRAGTDRIRQMPRPRWQEARATKPGIQKNSHGLGAQKNKRKLIHVNARAAEIDSVLDFL